MTKTIMIEKNDRGKKINNKILIMKTLLDYIYVYKNARQYM